MQLNDNQDIYVKKKAKWYFEPLVYTDAVFLTNEFLKEHGEMPLTLTQCQDLRQNAMEKGSALRLKDAIDHGTDYQDIVNRAISNNVSAMFDKKDETGKITPGIVDTYLRENGLMPKNLQENDTLGEYARTHEFNDKFMCEKFDALKYTSKNKDNQTVSRDLRYLDLFGKTYIPAGYTADKKPHWELIDTACLEAVQAYINTDEQAQISHLELSSEEKKDFVPYHLSRNDMFVYHDDMKELFHIHHNTQDSNDNEIYKYTTVNHSRTMPVFTYNDRTGLSQLRPYIGSDTIKQFTEAQAGNRIIEGEATSDQFQSVKNAIAIFDELNKRGLHYKVEADDKYGELRAIIDDAKMDVRVYDEANPNMVGRIYKDGVSSYFRSDFISKKEHAKVMPNEQMCRDLLAYNLGEPVESPYKNGDHTYIVGEHGPITVVNGKQCSNLKKTYANKPPVEYNASYVSNNNTNAFYDVANYGMGSRNIQVPITIYSKKVSSPNVKDIKFSSADEGKQYLVEKMQEANNNFKTRLLGENFGKPDEEGNIKFEVPESSDAKINALQENYLVYFEHDDAVLRYPNESEEEFKERVNEVKYATPEAQLIANSLFKTTPEQKIEGINEHYEHYAKTMFGNTNINGLISNIVRMDEESEEEFAARESQIKENNRSIYAKVATEDNPLMLNISNIVKYSDAESNDVIKALQVIGPNANVDFISEDGDFSMNRVREKMITYNDNDNYSLLNNRELSPFMEHVGNTVKSCLESQGCSVKDIRIDNQGIIKYDGKRDIAMTNLTSNGSSSEVRFSGTIGQIFEPDENGVIVTQFNHDDNHAIIPGYKANVERQKFGENKSVEERTICKGYEQVLDEQIRLNLHSNFMNQSFDSTLNNTELNSIYRHLYDERFPEDYKAHFRSLGMDDELMDASIKTLKGSVRYDSSYKESSTLNARLNASKSNIINDLNNDDYSVTNRDMSCLADSTPGYLDPIATSTGVVQGLSRYLVNGASVDESGHIQPARKEDGSINTEAKAPLLELEVCRNMDYNPFDRQQMTFSNLMHCLAVEDNVGVAHMTLGGWNMDDGYVISKEFAERHLVPSKDIDTTKNLDPKLIEAQISNKSGFVNSYQIEDGTSHVMFRGRDYDVTSIYQTLNDGKNTKTEAELCSELIKDKLIEDNIAIRPMQVGDKICDFNGNKGVCTLIVDRNMSDELAKKLQLEKEVALFHNNENLDIVGAPFTAPSRMNAGTARGMMEKPQDLILSDGSVKKGAMGYIPIIVTDMTVDEKTHIYDDEELAKGKGRKASSQLAWSLQARDADKIMKYCYGANIENIRSCREKMVALGMDMDDNYKIVKGFHYHTDANGEFEHRDIIEIGEPEIYVTNKRNMVNKDEQLKAVKNQLQQKGGFMKLPFPITLASGEETIKDDDGQYLLPILPPEYRSEQSYDDNTSILHDYTRSYVNIAGKALDYKARQKQLVALNNYDPENPFDNITIPTSLTPEELNEKWEQDLDDLKDKAQDEYNKYASKMKELNFEGKYNIWKRSIMSHRLPDSATAVWTGDPRLNLEEIGMSQGMMDVLDVKDGDSVLVWRDPQLRPEGVAYMKVKERDPEDLPLTGVAINPVMDKRFDGDFDGDSVAVVNFNDTRYSKAVTEAESRVGFMQDKYDETQSEDDLKKLNRAKDNLLSAKNSLDFIHDVQNQAQTLFGIENTLTDLGTTQDNPKERDDITFALNMGLDIASAKSYFKENGMHAGIEEEPDKAKDAILQGNNKEALDILNNMVHTCFRDGHGSDVVQYDSIESHLESQNRIIVDHKAKGKIDKMVEYAKYLGVDISFVDEDNNKVHMDDLAVKQKKDKKEDISHTYKVDTSEGSMTDYESSFLRVNTENSTLPQEVLEELKRRKEEVKDMFKQVEQATAIKSFGTGIAGSFSQRGVKVNANEAMLDTIELTYGATQGILQAKHDAVEAEQKYTILRETLPALWKGNQIEHREDGSWVPKLDENGKQMPATKEQFVEQYYELCSSKDGLAFDISKERVENVGEALYKPYVNSKGKEVNFRSPYADYGCTLDRLAYGGNFDTLVEKTGHRLFETKRGEMFRPNGNIAVNKNRTHTSDFYSKASMVYSKEAAIAAGEEKAEKRKEERKETERIMEAINKKSGYNAEFKDDNIPRIPATNVNKATTKAKTAVLIGSRPDKLYGYHKSDGVMPKYDALQQKILEKIENMYADGYKNFATTGLQGFNMLSFNAVEDFKKTHPDVKNILIVPNRDNGRYWREGEDQIFSKKLYYQNLNKADRVFDAANGSSSPDFAAMNKIVSKCDTIVAMYAEGDDSWKIPSEYRRFHGLEPSATANTMRAAQQAGSNVSLFEIPTDTIAFKERNKIRSWLNQKNINQAMKEAEKIPEGQSMDNKLPDYRDA